MSIINPEGFVAAREAASNQLHHFLKTSWNHPNPQEGKLIRTVCTRAILDIMVAKSIGQIAVILGKAEAALKPQIEQLNLFDKAA